MDLGKDQSHLKRRQTPNPRQEENHVPGNERDLQRSLVATQMTW